jgi:GDPmannose 4,6-dehydratase
MFGDVLEKPQTEKTPFNPVSPYACAKVYAHYITKNYREAYGLFACNGILFNHESPRRGPNFVTMKIVNGIKKIMNKEDGYVLTLGNLDSKRDWGHSKDYVYGMWLMLQKEKADDYILATGKTYSVREFVERAFNKIGINIKWEGSGLNEIGIDDKTNKVMVKINEKYFRPYEVEYLLGDPSKAESILNWKREYDTLDKLIDDMFL